MNIILFGVPGAGKGTQSTMLVERKRMKHISTGNLLRQAIEERVPLGIEADLYMQRGDLVPEDIVTQVVKNALHQLEGQSFVLDGFPRTLTQAKGLNVELAENNLTLDKAIFLDVPKELLMRRLVGRRVCKGCGMNFHIESHPPAEGGVCSSCGELVFQRPDDFEEAIFKRLEVYNKSTEPLKGYFEDLGNLVVLDGMGSPDEVFEKILEVFD